MGQPIVAAAAFQAARRLKSRRRARLPAPHPSTRINNLVCIFDGAVSLNVVEIADSERLVSLWKLRLPASYSVFGEKRMKSLMRCLFFCWPITLVAQGAATDQDIQALRAEASELKRRLAELENKLAAFQTVASPTKPVATESVESQPAPTGQVVAGTPPAPATGPPAAKPAPFAFGDFTWMNGQSRQKTQPLSNSFATVNLYLDTYYGAQTSIPSAATASTVTPGSGATLAAAPFRSVRWSCPSSEIAQLASVA